MATYTNHPGPELVVERPPEDSASEIRTQETKTKKKLVRRTDANDSQKLRRIFQFSFVALSVYLCVQFYIWVRYFETAGNSMYVERPAGVDGWLPIAALMNLKYTLVTHTIPAIHPAAMFLLVAFLTMSLLLKKSFCSWLCPIGTLSEYLWKLGRKIYRRNYNPPRWLDIPLRGLKYLLLSFFLVIIGKMSAEALGAFLMEPYGIIADVKMLNFFRHMGSGTLLFFVIVIVGSLFVQNLWCRYLCPYGAFMGIFSLLSPMKIRRDADACIDCAKCAKACPSQLPVDKLIQIRSAECTACMECVAVCPASDALQFSLAPAVIAAQNGHAEQIAQRWRRRALQPRYVAAVIAILFLGIVGYAKATGHWQTNIPKEVYFELVPNADVESHPGL